MNDLRFKVATLMGWTGLNWKEEKHVGRTALWGRHPNDERPYDSLVPSYESDISAAWNIVEWWYCKNEHTMHTGIRIFGDSSEHEVQLDDENDSKYSAFAPTLPEAICKAALKAGNPETLSPRR